MSAAHFEAAPLSPGGKMKLAEAHADLDRRRRRTLLYVSLSIGLVLVLGGLAAVLSAAADMNHHQEHAQIGADAPGGLEGGSRRGLRNGIADTLTERTSVASGQELPFASSASLAAGTHALPQSLLQQAEAQLRQQMSSAEHRALQAKVSIPDLLEGLLGLFGSQLDSLLAELPRTLGNCKHNNPPQPCEGSEDVLRQEHKFYSIIARWVTGLNTLSVLEGPTLDVDDEDGSMTLRIKLRMREMAVHLRLEGCVQLPFVGRKCVKVFDDANAIKETNLTLSTAVKILCNTSAPHLPGFEVEEVKISPALKVRRSIGSIKLDLKDITSEAEKGVKSVLGDFVGGAELQEVNELLVSFLNGADAVCESLKGRPEEASVVTTAAPTTTAASTSQTTATPPSSTSGTFVSGVVTQAPTSASQDGDGEHEDTSSKNGGEAGEGATVDDDERDQDFPELPGGSASSLPGFGFSLLVAAFLTALTSFI